MKTCSIIVVAPPGRKQEPVTMGLPWSPGALTDAGSLVVRDAHGRTVPSQSKALDCWNDNSVRWALVDWLADTAEGGASYSIEVGDRPGPADTLAEAHDDVVRIATGPATFESRTGKDRLLIGVGGTAEGLAADLCVEDATGRIYRPRVDRLTLAEGGPVRASVRAGGRLVSPGVGPLAEFDAWFHFFAGSPVVRIELTIRNPRRAGHPGNLWNLGDEGSIYLRDASVVISLPAGVGSPVVRCSPELGMPLEEFAAPFEIYQDSSGGENWRSSNHLNRRREVPSRFRGYRLGGGAERCGLRATPIVEVNHDDRTIAVAMAHFWQNFPKAIASDGREIAVGLFPSRYADSHELQGGEQKTHTFQFAFGPDRVSAVPLDWCREPARPHADPSWYCESEAVRHLIPRQDERSIEYLALVDSVVEGDDTFRRKREVIDEYGWRHFGEVYGDHEAIYHRGPTPLISHYNNQYDPIAGFAYQFLRSGDGRWWREMNELALHVVDIDIYHTKKDKNSYNNGLFWHTCHYIDADTCTHRSYPKARGVPGGGPSGGHLYSTGLALHHFLTGDPRSREASVGLAHYAIDAEDGRRTIFRWLDRGPTGHTTASGTFDYHGPGRGSGNSLNALLDGHRLTGEPIFLAKAEELIRRCIHPDDDITARNLLDAENKWFYTMCLQALGRYLDEKASLGQLDGMYAYSRASLLHYARWMAEHEYPYLDKPELLEYPTETWSAQDLRKSEVFGLAAKHAEGEERARFLERCEFFFADAVSRLSAMPTRTLARPVVLLLTNGMMRGYLRVHPEARSPAPIDPPTDFGKPSKFVPQKARAIRKAKALAVAGIVVALTASLGAVVLWPR